VAGSRILVGVTPGQPPVVLEAAARFARAFEAELVCTYVDAGRVITSFDPDGALLTTPIDPDGDEGELRFPVDLEADIADRLGGSGVAWTTTVVAGEPADALRREAERVSAELIVLGTRERGRWQGVVDFFAGSLAARLAHRQPRPVVVVPVAPAAPSERLPWEPA
jgi:nucleotide-binding universal stress UspA family protein